MHRSYRRREATGNKVKAITVSLRPDQLDVLHQDAEAKDVSVSEILRRLIDGAYTYQTREEVK
jgi:hypothetical protein